MEVKKLIVKTKDNMLLFSLNLNEWEEAVVDNSVEVTKYEEEELIITLKKDYENEWEVEVVEDWFITHEV